jgi:addiction module RelE/StbE family toxin
MVKEIIWSETAQKDRKLIFTYWSNRNKSALYSQKLNVLINSAVEIIAKFPQIGKPSGYKDTRIKIVRDYLIVYKEFPEFISIITIWDSRQDPKKLEDILK